MRVDNLVLATQGTGRSAAFIERLINNNAQDKNDFNSIVDAVHLSRRQALSSGVYDKIDGAIKWKGVNVASAYAAPYTRAVEFLRNRSKRLASLLPAAPTPPPPTISIEEIEVKVDAKPKRGAVLVQGGVTGDGALSLSVSGNKPYFRDDHIGIAEAAAEFRGVKRLPQMTILWKRFFMSPDKSPQIPMLEVAATVTQEPHHLTEFVKEESIGIVAGLKHVDALKFDVQSSAELIRDEAINGYRSPFKGNGALPPHRQYYYWTVGARKKWRDFRAGRVKQDSQLSFTMGGSDSETAPNKTHAISRLDHNAIFSYCWKNLRFQSALLFSKVLTNMDLNELALKHRLFLGGSNQGSNLPNMRGSGINLVGGSRLVTRGTGGFLSRRLIALGGMTRFNISSEVAVDLSTNNEKTTGESTLMEEVQNRLKPFAFLDIGYLASEVKACREALKLDCGASTGFGARFNVTDQHAIELAAVLPIIENGPYKRWHVGVYTTPQSDASSM